MNGHRPISPPLCSAPTRWPTQLDHQCSSCSSHIFYTDSIDHVLHHTPPPLALNLDYTSRRDSLDEALDYSPRHTIYPLDTFPPSSRLSALLSTDSTTVPHTDQQFINYTITLLTILWSQRDTCLPSVPSLTCLIMILVRRPREHRSTYRDNNSEHNRPH